MSKPQKVWRIVTVMLVVALIASASLTVVRQITFEPIKHAQEQRVADSIRKVITAEFDNNPLAEKIVVRRGKEAHAMYPARKDGYITSIAMKTFSNKGFGGRMDVIVGFFMDGRVSGYQVINHKETPGLGSKVNEPAFQKGIVGRNPSEATFMVRQDGGEIDAVTGATISSRAVLDAIKKAYRSYINFNTGGSDE